MVTELDVAVPVKTLPPGDPDRGLLPQNSTDLERQAKTYADVFQMVLSSRNCHGVNVWGFTDRYSWIPGVSGGREGAALLFDKEYRAKPARRRRSGAEAVEPRPLVRVQRLSG